MLRHFILNWTFLPFTDFKRGEYIFSSPDPAVRTTYRKQQTPQLLIEGTTEGCGFFCSLRLPSLGTILSPIAGIPITKCHETVILLNSFVRIFQKKMNDITRVMSKTEE